MNLPDAFYTSRVTEALDSLAIHVTSARNIAADLKPIKTTKLELKREERARAIINSIDPSRIDLSNIDGATTFTLKGKNLTKKSVTGFELFLEEDPSSSFSAVDVEPNDGKKVTEFTGSVDLTNALRGSYEVRIRDENRTPHLPGLIVEVEADEPCRELRTPLTIDIEPKGDKDAGDTVVLTANATGSPSSYRWFKNGNPIKKGTKKTLPITTGGNSKGTYSVAVSYKDGLLSGASIEVS